MRAEIQWRSLGAFLVVLLAVVVSLLVRWAIAPREPCIEILEPHGATQMLRLSEIERQPRLTRPGAYQNQYGNWRGDAVYSGPRLRDLLTEAYAGVTVISSDGYRARFTIEQVLDEDYPVVLAICVDGHCVPDLDEGFRIAVLPEDGRVSNEEYRAESAGSFWVRDVVRLELD